MSVVKEVQEYLSQCVGETLVSFDVNESSYGDEQTSSVVLTFSGGHVVSFSSHSFNDGSSCLDVDKY